jgi:hypothetical protein
MSSQNKKEEGDNLVTLSTGVVVRLKKANPMTLITVMAGEPRPSPPTYRDKKMGRLVENPDSPDYQARVQDWEAHYNERLLNAFIQGGTEIVTVPKGVPKINDDGWVDTLNVLGIDTSKRDVPAWRHIHYIKNVACQDEKDLSVIQEGVQKLSGVSEEDVDKATSFPGSDEEVR